jgi:hypothetical protein
VEPGDRTLEQCVPGEHVGAVDQQRQHPGGVSGRVDRLDLEGAGGDRNPRLHCPGRRRHAIALELVDQDRRPGMALEHLVDLGHVIVVVMGEQDVRQLKRSAPEELQQRLNRAAGVDHHRVAPRFVGHHVRVGHEVVVHRALDDHDVRSIISTL